MSAKMLTRDAEIIELLQKARRIAVVGASKKAERPSNRIFKYLVDKGYEVIPVNPAGGEIYGVPVARSLVDIEGTVDIVDVFRNPKDLDPAIVDAAKALGATCLWLQDGVIRQDIADRAIEAGLQVVMDDCIYRRHADIGFCEI